MKTDPNASAVVVTELTRRAALRRAAFLLGVAFSPSLVARVLRAQEEGFPGPEKSQGLSPQALETVSAVAERIIPRTDTPGAIDVGVPAFINLMCVGYLTADEHNLILNGVDDLEKRSVSSHGRSFSKLGAAEQDTLLQAIAREPQGKPSRFFRQLRELTILGYFTSEEVGKNVLHYNPVPGGFDACIPVSEIGNVNWTR
ncbi:MAG: gluconate 2-dehydrogenase subunit 3 family protein [Opitutaceae bacterium]|nr:gluconate 2-dehydrogenase subunit 3 family protein [Opitutaceae bacterium]